MMELVFNELTSQPYAKDFTGCYSRITQFVKTYKASKTHGFRRVRIQPAFDQIMLKDDFSLNDFVHDPRAKTLAVIMLSICHYPFIDDDTGEEKRYIQNNFSLLKDGNKIPVYGLAAAYLYQTICIGFCTEPFREALQFELQIEGSEKDCVKILSVSRPEHFEEQVFLEWKSQSAEIRLADCDIPVTDKRISLRDDHGKTVLQKFAERLILSPYVIEVVNSLPYNPHETGFIRKIKPCGLIEIVLTGTDKGLGLVIKTTGKNYSETEKIAQILKENFEQ
ncbi:MAG: hypothetical protein LBG15_08000 [Dysgonamonadaceae bacterium]|jgi:hypothetical protein|nr:hypothetical protein [Dysgonamonadaceae bacterium]